MASVDRVAVEEFIRLANLDADGADVGGTVEERVDLALELLCLAAFEDDPASDEIEAWVTAHGGADAVEACELIFEEIRAGR